MTNFSTIASYYEKTSIVHRKKDGSASKKGRFYFLTRGMKNGKFPP